MEISFLKRIIDANNNAKDNSVRIKPFETFSTIKFIIGSNPDQKCEILFSVLSRPGVKK